MLNLNVFLKKNRVKGFVFFVNFRKSQWYGDWVSESVQELFKMAYDSVRYKQSDENEWLYEMWRDGTSHFVIF